MEILILRFGEWRGPTLVPSCSPVFPSLPRCVVDHGPTEKYVALLNRIADEEGKFQQIDGGFLLMMQLNCNSRDDGLLASEPYIKQSEKVANILSEY